MSGTIYAVVYLINNTNTCISIPFSGASTPDAWGTQGDTRQSYPDYVVMPDGTPPRILAPGQTMVFGTKSDGGLLATSGTGGSLSIPLPDGETASMSWSVPWTYYNGGWGSASGNGSMSEPGFPPAQPFTINGGATGCSQDEQMCSFVFVLAGGPPEGPTSSCQLLAGQAISVPTSSPGPSPTPRTHSLTSPDGSTTLTIQDGALVLASPATGSTWSTFTDGAIAGQMLPDGNFAVYDAGGEVIWQTNTSGHPGAYLSVGTGKISVLVTHPGLGVTQTLWSASVRVPTPLALAGFGSFQALDAGHVLVLGSDRNLWLEQAPFGKVPPTRQQIDANVLAFQALDLQTVLVLGTNGNLWLEHAPFGKVPPTRQQIDANVLAFQALDAGHVLVLGSDRNLWLEQAPFGKVPPTRQQIDANVLAFQALDLQTVLVLGTNGNLWLEHAPFGKVPPTRQQIDANVQAFLGSAHFTDVFVLGTDGNLWLEQPPFGNVPPARKQVDGNVQGFEAMDLTDFAWVLGADGKLWLEDGPFGTVPPQRQQIDANVRAFHPLDLTRILVLGTNGNLWLENAPAGGFGQVPPPREQVDGNVG